MPLTLQQSRIMDLVKYRGCKVLDDDFAVGYVKLQSGDTTGLYYYVGRKGAVRLGSSLKNSSSITNRFDRFISQLRAKEANHG